MGHSLPGRIPPEVQVVPETSSDERMHVMDSDCWCGPESVPGTGGDRRVYIHHVPEAAL